MNRHDFTARKAEHLKRLREFATFGYDPAKAAENLVKAGGRMTNPVLDIGTGKGTMAIALAKSGYDVVSVDTDGQEQKFAEFLAAEAGVDGKIRFIVGDAGEPDFPDGSFGCVAMMNVLHHLANPEKVFMKAARVLKPRGKFIAGEFTPDGFDMVACVHKKEGRVHNPAGITLDSAEKHFAENGFAAEQRFSDRFIEYLIMEKIEDDK